MQHLTRAELLMLVEQLTQQAESLAARAEELAAQRADAEIMLETVVEHSTELEKQVCQQRDDLQTTERYVRQLNVALEERVRQRTAELEAANITLARESLERKQAQEDALHLTQQLLEQRSQTIERTYEAVHNGPLQELAILLRADMESFTAVEMRSHLDKISKDLRGIYQSMRLSVGRHCEELYLENSIILSLSSPLPDLLQQIFEHTLTRDFEGFANLRFQVTPDFSPLLSANLSIEQKRGLCLFLQEALCNVGKHALGTTRLSVVCQQHADCYSLQIIDNAPAPNPPVVMAGVMADAMASSAAASLFENRADLSDQQGTRQAQALAQQLSGTFHRRENQPSGTICELIWPVSKRQKR